MVIHTAARSTGALFTGFLLAGCLLLVAGCSSDETFRPPASISGLVTLDGQPLSSGSIQFTSPATGETASANIGSDGRYKVEFPAADIGSVYDVTIGPTVTENEDATAMMEAGQEPPQSPAPAKYRDRSTSGLTFTMKAEGENNYDVKLEDR